ncbi:hypothetical protein QAD02_019306 [Eretmocerus hayati]|uniref:Uncharacterized protein n=1 Tax=Eretmocerus hayati TaxID=131215 RepID=A0ACC2PIV1_9HYME|nr:hypothetical protein QAD02_019306 [Eretmocerus hayati]
MGLQISFTTVVLLIAKAVTAQTDGQFRRQFQNFEDLQQARSPPVNLGIGSSSPPPHSNDHFSSSSTLERIESDIGNGYKIMIFMRGFPGSGKSTLAKTIVENTVGGKLSNHIFGTDDYWLMINQGVYKYDESKKPQAQAYNENRVLNATQQGWSPIIVDDTNIRARDMKNYATMAVEHGYIIETLESNTPWSRNFSQLFLKNIHNISREVIQEKMDHYEPGIDGKKLMQILNLEYKPDQKPPQFRRHPPLKSDPTSNHARCISPEVILNLLMVTSLLYHKSLSNVFEC